MSDPPTPRSRGNDWFHRADRLAADLNVLLLLFAIGLAGLDLTCFVTQRVIDRLPEITRIDYVSGPAAANRTEPERPPSATFGG